MARVSLIEEDNHPELADLIARIRGARRGRLINIYKLLLHSPALAESWLAHNNAVRWKTELDGRLRELVIIRIGLMALAIVSSVMPPVLGTRLTSRRTHGR